MSRLGGNGKLSHTPKTERKKRNPNVYAIYRGDTFLDVGTIPELVARGWSETGVHSLCTRCKDKNKLEDKMKYNKIIVIKLDWKEDDND